MAGLTTNERNLAKTIQFDESVLLLLKEHCRKSLHHLIATNEDGRPQPADGVAIDVKNGDAAERVLAKVQQQLLMIGYRAFWTQRRKPNGLQESDCVSVLKTTDSYSIVYLMHTNGANYGRFTDDIIARLKDWEKQCRFHVVGAAYDWLAIQFGTLPQKLCAFAEDVYELCPDTVAQGVGLKREEDEPEIFDAARALCPDVSPKVEIDHQAKKEELAQLLTSDMLEQFRDAMQQFGSGETSPAMGVRLLAYEIQQKKYLFLWWD